MKHPTPPALGFLDATLSMPGIRDAGRKQLEIEAENWSKLTDAIARVLRMA